MYSVAKNGTRTYAQGLELLGIMIDWNKVYANSILNLGGNIFCVRTNTYAYSMSITGGAFIVDISQQTYKVAYWNGSPDADYSNSVMAGAIILYANGRMQ